MSSITSYDLILVGAGPVGCVTAAAHARKGARVLLLEANPNASKRLAGEWLHPSGVEVLSQLELLPEELLAQHPAGRGFAVFPDDGSEPIVLPYEPNRRALAADHGAFVHALRERVVALPGVDYRQGARVRGLVDGGVEIEGGERILAARVVGADGRGSRVRAGLGMAARARTLSHLAGVELRGVSLPFEGFGHVLLGGPGPILMYRIGQDTVRVCLDIPVGHPGARRDVGYLHEAFSTRMPATLRDAFRQALLDGRVQWALGRFHPRSFFGEGNVALVGDAAGCTHPLTAAGMTLGFADALALAKSDRVADYAKEREAKSYVPELLASALYRVFAREDVSAESMRQAVYQVWRRSPAERSRTMRLLAGDEVSLGEFGGAFLEVASRAAGRGIAEGTPLTLLEEWARWPVATLMPSRLRRRLRPHSSDRTPFVASNIDASTPAPSARRLSPTLRSDLESAIRAALEAVAPSTSLDLCRAKLDGTAPDGVRSAAETSRCARLELRLARREPDLDAVATELEGLLRARPTSDTAASAWIEALSATRARLPGLKAVEIERVLTAERARAMTWATGLTAALVDSKLSDSEGVTRVAACLRTLAALGVPAFHPRIRRLVTALAQVLETPDGLSAALDTTALAQVARGLLAIGVPRVDLAEACLARVHEQHAWSEASPVLLEAAARALALLNAWDAHGPLAQRSASDADRKLAKQSLLDVSRTFARPIEMLPGDLGMAVTCGYLLCRVADTVEDNPNLSLSARDLRYAAFLDVIEGRAPAERFEGMWDDVPGRATELHLCKNLGAVMRVFGDLPAGMQRRTIPWVAEMTRGMQLYSHRPEGDDGFTALHTEEDLDRYCYYVAGTVGHMLTDLFLEGLAARGPVSVSVENGMREHAESFGLGLQYTNILKDVTDDAERRCSFIPRTVCAREGLSVPELTDESRRTSAHRAVAPLFATAKKRLDQALEYTLSIPASAVEMRLFCLLPLFMAVRTLEHARGNDAMFITDAPVKIQRSEVEALIGECVTLVSDTAALRKRYAALWHEHSEPPSQAEAVAP